MRPTANDYAKALNTIEVSAAALHDRWVADLRQYDRKRAELQGNVSHPDWPEPLGRAEILAGIAEQRKTLDTIAMIRDMAERLANPKPNAK
jgi:hypothetical protein